MCKLRFQESVAKTYGYSSFGNWSQVIHYWVRRLVGGHKISLVQFSYGGTPGNNLRKFLLPIGSFPFTAKVFALNKSRLPGKVDWFFVDWMDVKQTRREAFVQVHLRPVTNCFHFKKMTQVFALLHDLL